MANTEAAQIQVVTRVAEILRLLANGRRELRASEVASELGLQRSTAHRYLASLAAVGLLGRDDGGSTYSAGPLMVQFAAATLGGSRVLEVAVPYMKRLVDEAHETVVLSLWGGHGPVVARVEEDSTRLVHMAVRVGSALPPDSAQAQVFRGEMGRHGVVVNSRVIEGVRAVAAPVYDDRGAVVATLAFVGTTATIPEAADSGHARALRETALDLSARLGWRELKEVTG